MHNRNALGAFELAECQHSPLSQNTSTCLETICPVKHIAGMATVQLKANHVRFELVAAAGPRTKVDDLVSVT